jgi:hypothetical protein
LESDRITLFNDPRHQYDYESSKNIIHDEEKYLYWNNELKLHDPANLAELQKDIMAMKAGLQNQIIELDLYEERRDKEIQGKLPSAWAELWCLDAGLPPFYHKLDENERALKKQQLEDQMEIYNEEIKSVRLQKENRKELKEDIHQTLNTLSKTQRHVKNPWQELFSLYDRVRA